MFKIQTICLELMEIGTLSVVAESTPSIKQALRVARQYASASCKLKISSHLFARWQCCSGMLAI